MLGNETQRYAVVGAVLGFAFPILATVIRFAASAQPFKLLNIIILHVSDPLMWIIDTAPLFLGAFAAIAGRRQDKLQSLFGELRLRESELAGARVTLEENALARTRELERRTLELETIAEVARDIAVIRDLDTLLNVSVNLIRERFKYYHCGIYLMDERGEVATLQVASGASAQQMTDLRHKLNIGALGNLATVLRSGQAYVALDVGQDEVLGRNPFLRETTSEIVLPLRVLNNTIGVLDIHSNLSASFEEREVAALQLLADQLAAAIQNAQLVQQVENSMTELSKSYRSETQQAWAATVGDGAVTSFEYDGQQVRQIPVDLSAEYVNELEKGKAIALKGAHGASSQKSRNTLLVPIAVLGQLIGVIGLEQDDPNHAWTKEEIAVAEAAANRAALTLENARLLRESQRRATKERTISDATARIGVALNIENILDITSQELERVIANSEVILQINTESRSSTDR